MPGPGSWLRGSYYRVLQARKEVVVSLFEAGREGEPPRWNGALEARVIVDLRLLLLDEVTAEQLQAVWRRDDLETALRDRYKDLQDELDGSLGRVEGKAGLVWEAQRIEQVLGI